ncbi:hypothetical protein D3OALGA1CA_1843 [Olavius algarvensis associated proteobacterium Delta 3]|nr:hypothetical protein D3OALGA1CA_1843 [Olavius algarvensis associated proteobacterium Delta 3]
MEIKYFEIHSFLLSVFHKKSPGYIPGLTIFFDFIQEH